MSRLMNALGLCRKAGALICGTDMICTAMRGPKEKRPILVLEASDTSDGTHKKINDKCSFYGVRAVRIREDSGELARAVGKTCGLAAVAVTDENLAKLIEKSLEDLPQT